MAQNNFGPIEPPDLSISRISGLLQEDFEGSERRGEEDCGLAKKEGRPQQTCRHRQSSQQVFQRNKKQK